MRWGAAEAEARFRLHDPSPITAIADNCGEGTVCTGLNNVLLLDLDGSLLGHGARASLLTSPANGSTAHPTLCSPQPQWGGLAYLCAGEPAEESRFDLMFFENSGGDSRSRYVHPVHVALANPSEAGWGSTQHLNAFEDNGWTLSYTSLKRLARFPAVVRLGEKYNITFAGTNPRQVTQNSSENVF